MLTEEAYRARAVTERIMMVTCVKARNAFSYFPLK